MTTRTSRLAMVCGLAVAVGCAANRPGTAPAPLAIQEQGSFAVGGTVVTAPGTFDLIAQGAFSTAPDPRGQTLHGDHAYVFYQVPVNAPPGRLPLVFWHGHGQSAKSWETTPDGREGFQTIFLRRGYPVYLLDQPRRGRAARSTQAVTIPATPDEQLFFGIFRLGVWPALNPGVQFPRDSAALDQFFRQMVPNTGPYDVEANTNAVAALFDKIGPGVLVTHSQSGTLGWRTGIKSRNVRAIVSFEPGGDFVFPEGEAPPPMTFVGRTFTPPTIPLSDFMQLTKIPIAVYYGDNIPEQPTTNPLAWSAPARAQDAGGGGGGGLVITRAAARPSRVAPAENFTGRVRVQPLFDTTATTRAYGASVSFEAGARTAWHTHPRGQVLIVTEGVGRVQRWGAPPEEIRPGDVVRIPPGAKHWHGASATTAMTHIAIVEHSGGRNTVWLEQVSDEQYGPRVAEPSRAQQLMGDIAPKLAQLTDSVLFGDVWARPGLSPRDRSLVTVSALIAMNRPDQLRSHLVRAHANGVTRDELIEVITHLAFYAGWPSAVTAVGVAREVLPQQ